MIQAVFSRTVLEVRTVLQRTVLQGKTVLGPADIRQSTRQTIRERAVGRKRLRGEGASGLALAVALAASGLVACGAAGNTGEENGGTGADTQFDVGQVSQPIVGGETDREHSAVLAIALVTKQEEALCSGSLIAPNLVLTARHCVAVTAGEKVDCSQSTFGSLHQPSELWVSSSTSVSTGANFHPVRKILVPEEGELCGSDIALMILDGQFRSSSIAPIAPRLDAPALKGEPFTAVGFGDALTDGDPGIRRALEGLQVVCGPNDCNAPQLLTKREFVGEQGVCDGDSGGPALDAEGRVVGVASRATEDCGLAVYSAVSPWRDWIVGVAEQALDEGDYTAPAWLTDGEDAIAAGDVPSGGSTPGAVATGSGSTGSGSTGSASTGSSAVGSGAPTGEAGDLSPNTGVAPKHFTSSGCSIAAVGSGSTGPIGTRTANHTAALAALALAGVLGLRRPRRG